MTPELPEHGVARSSDPETSHQAAAEVDVSVLYGKIMAALAKQPMTTGELAIETDVARDSISPRMKPMVAAKLIVKTGKKRPNPISGKQAIIWRLATDDEKNSQLPLPLAAAYTTKQMQRAMASMLASDDEHISSLARRFCQAAKDMTDANGL